jgi:hypothetical protein
MKLGRRKPDPERLKLIPPLHRYLYLPPAPPSADWSKGITNFGMMLNDSLGDCTIAAVAHAIQIFSANASTEVTVPDSTVLEFYEKWDGYVNGDPSTDNGGVELDVLASWKSQTFAGHVLDAYADPPLKKIGQIRSAINLFGGLYIGLEVPNYVMNSLTSPGSVWDVQADDGIAGGHAVFVHGYDQSSFKFISWGGIYSMTNRFWKKYVDEAHALISADFINAQGFDPQGLNLSQLQTDLAQL